MKTKLSEIVKGRLREKDINLSEFSEDVQISIGYLSEWLNGKIKNDPSNPKISRMEEILGMIPGELISKSTRSSRTLSDTTVKLALNTVIEYRPETTPEINTFSELIRKKPPTKEIWRKIIDLVS